jgi:hypothetical protein
MKQAHITLKLTKDHEVHLKDVTPIEALLLAAEHNRNVGGQPVEVETATIKECGTMVKDAKGVEKFTPRTVDEELDRLKLKYAPGKIKAVRDQVSDLVSLADDYVKALDRGMKVVAAKGGFSQ